MTDAPERLNISKALGGQWVAFDDGYGQDYIRLDLHEAAVAAARAEGMTADQRKHLPDLVSLALVGFALLKNDDGASEWSHPAIAAFRDDVEPVLNERRAAALEEAARKWGHK